MALTTISSLAESYASGIPPSHEIDLTNMNQDKSNDMNAEMEAVPLAIVESGVDGAEEGKDNAESEDSDSDGSGMLEVHD
jgi:hypothetical protein